ncbi:hypothetical protein BV22DRAFT_1042517 [Leucogyrophana mollusca]|uniref:Uncharacterized protein n=1 Tax=Leucogyrophana mollusca TaxID=85980 RepID=A0ACB8AUX9_9AGAM|nr:hypothetical protein BV22DRAFT_1042517 [Leucogyrophana mollusca]
MLAYFSLASLLLRVVGNISNHHVNIYFVAFAALILQAASGMSVVASAVPAFLTQYLLFRI